MQNLVILMLESLVVIITIAFIMTRIDYVRKVVNQCDVTLKTRFSVIMIFGLFGIIGSYTGVVFNTQTGEAVRWTFSVDENEAIINFRVLGIVTAGLIGGVRVGVGAGVIAGVHTAKSVYETRTTLKDLLQELGNDNFVQIHRNYLFNHGYSGEYRIIPDGNGAAEIVVSNCDDILPVSRHYYRGWDH